MKFGKRHYRPQVDQMDCGVASLAMVFGYYGSYYFLAHLRELAKTTMDGTTALGLVKVAEEIGFETRAIKADMTLFDLPDLTFPFVAHVLKEGKLLHYYVVTGQDKDSIHIADPDPGVKLTKLPRERFEEEWTGVTLFMAPSPDYKPHKEQKNGLLSFIPILVKQRGLIANIVLATLLVTVINIVGSYYLQSIIDTYVPDQMRSTLGIISIGLVIVYIFEKLNAAGVATHFVEKLSDTEQLNKKVKIIPLEVVLRNYTAGSFSKRFGVDEGIALETPIVEFYYKNDDLDDPFINDEHVKFLQIADDQQIAYLKEETRRINELLKVWFAEIGLKLIDFKLEFGFDKDGKIILADEFSPDNCRLWDADGNHMDKDVFRRGLGELTDVYEIVWEKLQGLK